jgi:predicted MPP superfamily phosphohydrolase
MFGVILISAVTMTHVYVLWRASSVPLLRRQVSGEMLVTAGLALWVLFLLGRVYGHDSPGALATVLELAGMIWMAIVFLIAVPMLAVDVITGFGMLLPGAAPRMRGAAIVIGALLSVIALVQGTRQPVVQNYDVQLLGLPPKLEGTVIVGLSDLHLGSLRNERWLNERVSQVQAERPDVIVLLGDIFEGHGWPSKELVAGLQGLKASMGVWAVLGNHEFHGRDDGIVPLFQEAGITVLRNERAMIRPGLVLAGVDDLTSNHRSGSNTDLITRALTARSSGATVLLSHTPWNADRAAKAGTGLMLCGHTHGGQIWPFGYLVMSIYPLLAGRYDVDGMTVIVSRGAGSWGPPMRLWQPGEIIRVTLRAKKKEV